VVTTLAGSGNPGFADGTGLAASFKQPCGIAVDRNGTIYVADASNLKIRKITPSGVVSTLAASEKGDFEDGTGEKTIFRGPAGIALDDKGNLYTAEWGGCRIRKITPKGIVTTLAGSGKAGFADGSGEEASFDHPHGIAVDREGNVYVGDTKNHRVRKITPNGIVTTLAGSGIAGYADGVGAEASFSGPMGVAVDRDGNVYISEGNRIRKITPEGVVTTLAGSGKPASQDGNGVEASFNGALGLTIDQFGDIYVAESTGQKIRRISPDGRVSTIAGSGEIGAKDGDSLSASFNNPWGVAIDEFGAVYVSDQGNKKIRKIYQSSY
jgi:sugar lactone lactonase YvrE